MKRIVSLDYLRGVCALLILTYHYYIWTFGEVGSNTFLGRMGIYGVSIFYVLSGMTLHIVYKNISFSILSNIIKFFTKRILRIYPLMWFVTVCTIIISFTVPEPLKLFLNLTGLFGFFQWDNYFATGLWSIGNELVFYTFIPIFFLLYKTNRNYLFLLGVVILIITAYFSFFKLNIENTLSEQWRNYINPLNQLIFFYCGFTIPIIFEKANFKFKALLFSFLLCVIIFIFYPVEGDQIFIVTKWNRLIFILLSCTICIITYKLCDYKLPGVLDEIFVYLGEISYSVYLIHPIVYTVNNIINNKLFNIDKTFVIVFSVILTILLSHFSFKYIENIFKSISMKLKFVKKSFI